MQQSPIDRYVKPDYRWEFEKAIRGSQNFFKHADKDAEAVLDFNPHETELLLFIDNETFRQLSAGLTDPMNVFVTYAAATWGKAAFEAVPGDVLAGVAEVAAEMAKHEFFSLCMDMIDRGRAG